MTACCTNDNVQEMGLEKLSTLKRTTISQVNLKDLQVADEQDIRKLESLYNSKVAPEMVTNKICERTSVANTFDLLRNNQKTIEDYEMLALRDGQLEFKSLEYGSVKYLGQVRNLGKALGDQ